MSTNQKTTVINSDRGQVNRTAAEIYETFFLPALFAEWPDRVADAAAIGAGQRVLDVACGTGVLARTAATRTGAAGSVVGIDVNEGMLAVAQRIAPDIEWRQGVAEALPYAPHSFDAVVSQFGLMFFTDKRAALAEMARVLRPSGRLAVAVWASLEETPGYAAMVGLLQRLFGDEAANGLRAPYSLGDVPALHALCRDAGLPQAQITTYTGTARFSSIQSWVYTDIKGWTLADAIDDEQYARLLQEAETVLRPFVDAGGAVAFPAPAHIITAQV